MNIAEQILQELQKEYASGLTQQEIAKAHNVTHPQIQRLLSRQRDCSGLSIGTVARMFPNATINLHGSPVITATNSGVNNGIMGINNGNVQSAAAESFRDRAIRAILDLDLPPEATLSVLKTLKDLK